MDAAGKRRSARLASPVGLLLIAAFAGCSSRRIAYEMAPTLVTALVDHALGLRPEQRALLKQGVVAVRARHRREELPLYAARVDELRDRLRDGLSPDDVRWAHQVGEELVARFAALVAPDLGGLLATFDDHQLDRAAKRIDDQRRERLESVERATRREVAQIEPWIGPLTREQRALVTSFERRNREELILRKRIFYRRQQELVDRVRKGPRTAEALAAAVSALLDPSRDPADRAVLDRVSAEQDALFLALDRTLSAAQRRKLDGELVALRRDFLDLAQATE